MDDAAEEPAGPMGSLGGITMEAARGGAPGSTEGGTFADRQAAGRRLAEVLEEQGIDADVVLAIPRGGLPLGRAVAEDLGLPLDVIIAKKIGAPFNEELAIGAATPDGEAWLNEDILDRMDLGQDALDQSREKAVRAAEEKARRYRPAGPQIDLSGKRVLIVDDGIATGATIRAGLRSARAQGADEVVLAVPVGPPSRIDELRKEADRVICLQEPAGFRAVGQFYASFSQVSDEEAIDILEATG